MTSPTGNRWVNQDTGEIANKDNIQTDLPGNPAKAKYGPEVTGEGEPPAATEAPRVPVKSPRVAVGESLGAFEDGEELRDNPAGESIAAAAAVHAESRKLGPLDQGKTEANAELEQLKLDIRNFRRVAIDVKSPKDAVAAAQAQLGQIAAIEYGRQDGGRAPIKAALARAGFANPNREG